MSHPSAGLIPLLVRSTFKIPESSSSEAAALHNASYLALTDVERVCLQRLLSSCCGDIFLYPSYEIILTLEA